MLAPGSLTTQTALGLRQFRLSGYAFMQHKLTSASLRYVLLEELLNVDWNICSVLQLSRLAATVITH